MTENKTAPTDHPASGREAKVTYDQVVEALGDVPDSRVAAILATQATLEEFEEAVAWALGESDVVGELERPLAARVRAVFDVLTVDEAFPNRDDEPQ